MGAPLGKLSGRRGTASRAQGSEWRGRPLPPHASRKETFKVDAILPEYRYLQPGPKFPTRMKQWRQAMALPEDAMTYLLEITKFLATGALILATGVLLLLLG